VSAERLKPLIVYFALAFVVLLAAAAFAPAGRVRDGLVMAWIVLFPFGGWLVFRRG
jgi:hypothetical protein